jgi:hypothetical protein
LIAEGANEQDAEFISRFVPKFKKSKKSAYEKINELIKLRASLEKWYPRFQAKNFAES